jgi:hypothetical protein
MKRMKLVLTTTILMLAMNSMPAAAHGNSYRGPRVSFGIGIGITPSYYSPYYARTYYARPYYSGSYYGRPYYPYSSPYYYPEVVVNTVISPTPPTIYVQQTDNPSSYQNQYASPSQPASVTPETGGNDWYYCNNPDGFYPAIRSCPAGWQRIAK